MRKNSRIFFQVKGQEEVLLEAIVKTEKDPVQISYQQGGLPHYRGFLFSTVQKRFESGEWVIISIESLAA